ncbi:MAG TPA: hypothetical protein VFW66_13455 [Gemmatimonadales bacterium]|nr:hypothetical protein [Gemmatimonadales bacterium]
MQSDQLFFSGIWSGNMDELINQVAQRTGLAPDKARSAVETVLGFLKGRLPGPIASQLDNALAGDGSTAGAAQAAKGLGGVFGSR